MTIVLAIVIGVLYAAGIYLMLLRNLARLIIGLSLLTNAVNLLIFTVSGLTRAAPPLVPEGLSQPPGLIDDPVPQSLILTAIVIGFGVLAFSMVLAYRTFQEVGTDDLDELKATDELIPRDQPYLVETYDGQLHPEPETVEPVPSAQG